MQTARLICGLPGLLGSNGPLRVHQTALLLLRMRKHRMRALAITASFFIITVLSGCLGSNNSSSAPTLAFLYIVGNGDNSIRGLAEKTTGDLQSLPVSVFTTSPRPVSLALHPSKNFLYVPNLTSNTVSGFNVDHINGVLTPIGTAVPPTPTQLQ